MTVPELWSTPNGHQSVCGRCMTYSVYVRAPDAFLAWTELLALGWTTYRPVMGGRCHPYPVCPKCSAEPDSIDLAVQRAQKRRKRK